MSRAIDLSQGIAYVVTDLHGAWQPYICYRDHFLALHQQSQADFLILLGDVIHGYGPAEQDHSLPILLDLMRLQSELGLQTVIMLLGNHELPHLYGISLAKGNISFTPRFEHSLGHHRPQVIAFLKSLPFCVRTLGGVMLTHAGAAARTANPHVADWLLNFNHDDLLAEAEHLIAREDIQSLLHRLLGKQAYTYDELAHHLLAVTGPDDPRYYDLLRGFVVSNLEPEWSRLWDFFFTQCEAGYPLETYRSILERFLDAFSPPGIPQNVLVTGHIVVQGGYAIIGEQQLRLASWAHARPHQAGCFLLFDVAMPCHSASDLLPFIHPLPC